MDASAVWVQDAPAFDDQARRTLEAWARAHGVVLAPPRNETASAIAIDTSLAGAIEGEIERARDAVMALDVDLAEHALARAEASLHDHPELPQAAWLLAEVERGWASRWLRGATRDDARAERAWQRAAALDGGRAPGVGEEPFAAGANVDAVLAIDGAEEVIARIDGAPVTPGPLERGAGAHQITLAARDGGAVVWAAWVSLAEGTVVRIHAPLAPACAASDLAHASIAAGIVRAEGVRCARWIAAARSERNDAVRVATCEASRCGRLVEWSAAPASIATEPVPHEKRRWPAWGTWALIGAGVAAISVTAIVASGALEARPVETRFVSGGVRTEGAGFAF